MRVYYIPYDFLTECFQEGHERDLAFWLKLKSLYTQNTILYKWSIRKIMRETGMAYATVKKYLPRILDHGWAEIHKDTLILRSWTKMGHKSRNKEYIAINRKTTFNEVVDRLRAMHIQRDKSQQEFRIKLTSGGLKANSSQIKKWWLKYEKREEQRKVTSRVLTSCRRVAHQSLLSPSGAHHLIRRLTRKGILKMRPWVECVQWGTTYHPSYHIQEGFVFWKGGGTFINRGFIIG